MAPEAPMVVFINPKSGGRHGPVLKERLQQLMTNEQVFDLTEVKPHEFVWYGLVCLETMAMKGDKCAKECRERIRVMVAGGDGTVGWVLECLGELHEEGKTVIPPVGIVPLGTGNDLSRTFGWVQSYFSYILIFSIISFSLLIRDFMEARCNNGLLEIFGLKHEWHASFVMAELISAKHIAQAAAVRFELRGGDWKDEYLQMDGEPWKQPMNTEYSTFAEIKRVPFQSLMINGA